MRLQLYTPLRDAGSNFQMHRGMKDITPKG